MYNWVVFLHVVAAMTFFLAHGAAAAVAFKIPGERKPERIKALLELSTSTLRVMFLSLLVLLLAGIVAGFIGRWWNQAWIWISLVSMIAIFIWMTYYSRRTYAPLRKAIGLEYFEGMTGGTPNPPVEPLPDDQILAISSATSPTTVVAAGYVVSLLILWLMIFKPF